MEISVRNKFPLQLLSSIQKEMKCHVLTFLIDSHGLYPLMPLMFHYVSDQDYHLPSKIYI